jgi:hypothetical protein
MARKRERERASKQEGSVGGELKNHSSVNTATYLAFIASFNDIEFF